ncbi:hypothetical protein Poli38472_013924 [Pythium oligandrum]|uniref:Uncharacterized protein n=1 Tax=Pythium oligandrum TaxID=41045 RepID=A0A8K1C2B9_PYTOL|nr:hypothetical protein Poli38472_013924 [Pythium oligandrum]|eukprot:TMW55162.1 hypothetical protein Poli38472_013924 [Pythium oligandrum]
MSDGDWYVETVKSLVIVFACSITTFILVFIILATCTRLHFSGNAIHKRETLDTPELILIKHHTRATRLLSVVGIMLQAMLVKEMTSVSDDTRSQASYSFSLFRPVSNLCLYFLGFMTNTHAFFRIAFILLLVQVVVVDALSAVTLAMLLNCLQSQGLRCGDALSSLSQDSLDFLLVRDKISLFLNPWLMLEVAYLGVAIGFCSSRYSSRRLSLSRPTFNVRAALAVYFPERFGAHVAPLHRSRRPRPAKQWTA